MTPTSSASSRRPPPQRQQLQQPDPDDPDGGGRCSPPTVPAAPRLGSSLWRRAHPQQNPMTLQFPKPLEAAYNAHFDTVKAHQDWTAGWLYALMVLPGFTAILLAATVMPGLWNAQVAGCATYSASTSVVAAGHLALMALMRGQRYISARQQIVAVLRVLYMLTSVTSGLQQCSTITKWGPAGAVVPESPFSAFLWRTGVLAMVWHSAAFRLPFWQHFYIQSATAMAYCMLLADSVCADLYAVQHGPRFVALGQRMLQGVAALWGFAGFVVSSGDTSSTHLFAAADDGSGSSIPGSVCLSTIRVWQVLVGHVLLSAVLYVTEAIDRVRWRHAHDQQQEQRQRPQRRRS